MCSDSKCNKLIEWLQITKLCVATHRSYDDDRQVFLARCSRMVARSGRPVIGMRYRALPTAQNRRQQAGHGNVWRPVKAKTLAEVGCEHERTIRRRRHRLLVAAALPQRTCMNQVFEAKEHNGDFRPQPTSMQEYATTSRTVSTASQQRTCIPSPIPRLRTAS